MSKKLLQYPVIPLEFLKVIGKGSFGEVSLYHDPYLDKPLVVKKFQTNLISSEDEEQRIRTEVITLSHLSHPSIPQIFGYWKAEDTLYMSMEYINGWTLREAMDCNPRHPTWFILSLIWDLFSALEYAHGSYAHKSIGPVIHRDLKPSNLMIGFDGRLSILDFGISRNKKSADLTQNHIIGSTAYMSPEQAQGERIDTSSDIFSAGIILWELLTGKHPFRSNNDTATLLNICNQPLKADHLPSQLSKPLKTLVHAMLQKDPRKRPNAQTVLHVLEVELAPYQRNLHPFVGQYLLHIRKPEKVVPPSPPLLDSQKQRIPLKILIPIIAFASLALGYWLGHV